MNFTIANSLMFFFGWVWCILLGTAKVTFFPVLFSLISITLQLIHVRKTSVAAYCLDIALAIYAFLFGFLMETLFLTLGIFKYATVNSLWNHLPPAWISMLYPVFSLILNHALSSFFNKKPILSIPVIAALASLSYRFTARIDGLRFSIEWDHPYLFIFFCWMIFLIILYFLNKIAAKAILELFDSSRISQPITVLYNGAHSLFHTHANHLKQRNADTVVFIDTSLESYQNESYHNISPQDTMQTVHVINARGAILHGLDAFREIYIRCDYPMLSLCYTLPIFKTLFGIGYRLLIRYQLSRYHDQG